MISGPYSFRQLRFNKLLGILYMRRTALALLAGLAIATTISAPASAMSSVEAYGRQGADVLFHGYKDVSPNKYDPLRVIEKKREKTKMVDLPDTERLVSPAYEIHTDHDDPYGPCGAFYVEIKAGTKSICVFEGPQVGMSFPAVYETVDGGKGPKKFCKTITKTMTGRGLFGNYEITTKVERVCDDEITY